MIHLSQKRIRRIEGHLPDALIGFRLVVGVPGGVVTESISKRLDISFPLVLGERILPPVLGPATRFNAKGLEKPLRDQPKETHYRDFEFTRIEWHGKDQLEKTDIAWIPYQKYPRDFIEPPGLEISITTVEGGECFLAFDAVEYEKGSIKLITSINVLLEVFGECYIFEEGKKPIALPKSVSLNWQLLPEGEMPWDRLSDSLSKRLDKQRPKSKAAAMRRFEQIASLSPDFCAVGRGGFCGYVVFGFSGLNLYVLESQTPNNAIYIFDKDWMVISRLTKAQIIQSSAHVARIVHSPEWFHKLRSVLKC